MNKQKHPVINNQELVDKVVSRRGRLHAFESLDPKETCLVVIDLMVASIEADPRCAELFQPINKAAKFIRAAGGQVAWVTTSSPGISELHIKVFGEDTANLFHERAQPNDARSRLHEHFVLEKDDIFASKQGFSAFFPGRSNLIEQLDARGVNTVMLCGTVTNVCCESSARDAVELGLQTVLLADLCKGHAHGLHEATLATFFRSFGDVRLSSEIPTILER